MALRVLIPQRGLALIWCLVLCLAFAGCDAHFLSNYDEILDRAVTDTQKKTDAFLLKMQDTRAPQRRYAVAKPIYEDILNDVHSLKSRAQANNSQNLNEITIKQIDLLDDSIRKLQAQHEKTPNGVGVGAVRATQDLVDVQFETILKLEIAKKRGVGATKG